LLFQGSILLAIQLLGAHGAALWGSLRIMLRAGCQLLELVSQTLSPEFQIAAGESDRERLRSLHATGLIASLLIAMVALVLLGTVGPVMFNEWTNHQFSVSSSAWWVLIISLIPFSLWWVSGEVQRVTHSPWYLNLCGVFAACVSLSVMCTSIYLGIMGMCLGALAFESCMAACILKRTLALLDESVWDAISRGVAKTRHAASWSLSLVR
jgi:O-antigen/teichoic acid export membrane protein